MSAAAGWYPDPSGAPRQRWWDGAQWTAYERDAPVAPAPAAPSAPPCAAPAYAAQPYAAAPPAAYAATGMPSKVQVDTNTVWIWLAIVATVLPGTDAADAVPGPVTERIFDAELLEVH